MSIFPTTIDHDARREELLSLGYPRQVVQTAEEASFSADLLRILVSEYFERLDALRSIWCEGTMDRGRIRDDRDGVKEAVEMFNDCYSISPVWLDRALSNEDFPHYMEDRHTFLREFALTRRQQAKLCRALRMLLEESA